MKVIGLRIAPVGLVSDTLSASVTPVAETLSIGVAPARLTVTARLPSGAALIALVSTRFDTKSENIRRSIPDTLSLPSVPSPTFVSVTR
ncbi:hypothetical protein D3C79_714770 [compost metagenome]